MSGLSGRHDKRRRPVRRRTKAQVEQLDQELVDVLVEDHPQSVRHAFYRMTDPTLPEPVEKSEHGYQQVQHRLKLLRRGGRIPYGWITDATRRGYRVETFDGAADFIRQVHGAYRANLWQHADHYVEVWCESRSIAGVIDGLCRELAVPLYPAGGFSSITLAYEAAEFINAYTGEGEIPADVLYIGDYDPAGVLIDRSIEAELHQHLHPDVVLQFHRIAINQDQIKTYKLPTKPRKATDRRALHIERTVEAEAMPASLLRKLLREAIEGYLPERALDVVRQAEASERAYLLQLADAVGASR